MNQTTLPSTNFADLLHQFALSVDLVGSDAAQSIEALCKAYLVDRSDFDYFLVYTDDAIDAGNRRGLRGLWSNGQKANFAPLRNEDNEYTGQCYYSYDRNKPLWITHREGKNLASAQGPGDFLEDWSKCNDLPLFWNHFEEDLKTSIVIPLSIAGRAPIGFFCVESKKCFRLTEALKSDLLRIALSLAILVSHNRSTELQSDNTRKALENLTRSSQECNGLTLGLPVVFFAFSSEANKDVLSEVTSVMNDHYADKLELVRWDKINASGNINIQVLESIGRATYGICYTSEPATGEHYQDNGNVLFESGMLHALTNSVTAAPDGWIPIREEDSPPTPFDFASERAIIVKRSSNSGELNAEHLTEKLKAFIDTWLTA